MCMVTSFSARLLSNLPSAQTESSKSFCTLTQDLRQTHESKCTMYATLMCSCFKGHKQKKKRNPGNWSMSHKKLQNHSVHNSSTSSVSLFIIHNILFMKEVPACFNCNYLCYFCMHVSLHDNSGRNVSNSLARITQLNRWVRILYVNVTG